MFRAESVGTDTTHYLDLYGSMKSYIGMSFTANLGRSLEILFSSIVTLVANFNLPSRFIVIFLSVTTFLFLHLAFKRFTISYPIGVLLYLITFYLSSFNIARQMCAASILLYGFTFLFETNRKKYYYIILVLLATTIHGSSLVYLSLFCFRFLNPNFIRKKTYISIAVCYFCVNILFPFDISAIIIGLLGSGSSYTYYAARAITHGRSFFGALEDIMVFIPLILIFNQCVKSQLDKFDLLFYITIVCTFLISNMQSDISRVLFPIIMFQIIYISHKVYTRKISIYNIAIVIFIFVKMFFTLYGASQGLGQVSPYLIDFNL